MKDSPKKPRKSFDAMHSIAVASGAGMTMLTCIGICLYIGLKCDEYFGTDPYGVMGFGVLGAAAGLWSVIKMMLEK
jgi:ATP synthase protein I